MNQGAVALNVAQNIRAISRRKPTDKKRTLGIFYTPKEVSQYLTEWAIASPTDTVLEPSFGGCGFLAEAAKRLAEKGSQHAWSQLCGCDKDSNAFSYLPSIYRKSKSNRRFLHRNFLETTPSDYCISQFDVVIGNPPYVSRHNMRKYQLDSADNILAAFENRISRRASLWVHFILHSFNFLKKNGRMAWVLPRSLSQSKYGNQVIHEVAKRFSWVKIISPRNQFFLGDGAEEIVDILLCRGFDRDACFDSLPTFTYADSVDELADKIRPEKTVTTFSSTPNGARQEMLSESERLDVETFERTVGYKFLGDLAELGIGIVTGLKGFFVLDRLSLSAVGLSEHNCTPLLTRSSYIKGLSWDKVDIDAAALDNKKVFLVRHDDPATQTYWSTLPPNLKEKIATFKKRETWNKADDGKIPAAFFVALVNNAPRIVLNAAATNCNNSIYRLNYKSELSIDQQKEISLLALSSYSQLSGELTGRICGSGGLKFEPSDAARLRIPNLQVIPSNQIAGLWTEVDALIRNGREEEATMRIDNAIYTNTLFPPKAAKSLKNALHTLRKARKRSIQ